MVALSVAVYDHTHSAVAVAAMLVSGQVLPAFAVPALIARVEASTRRRELSALYLFEAAATCALAVVLWHFWLPAVLLLVALDGTAALAAGALLRTAAARAAREEHAASRGGGADPEGEAAAEQSANAAINVAFSTTFVLGRRWAARSWRAREPRRRCSRTRAHSSPADCCCWTCTRMSRRPAATQCGHVCGPHASTSWVRRHCARCCSRRRSPWSSSSPRRR